MGERDHSIKCETCGLQRGGLNDLKCRCDWNRDIAAGLIDPGPLAEHTPPHGMKHRVIQDSRLGLILTLANGADGALARISWLGGSCVVDARALCAGRWELFLATQEVAEDELPRGGNQPPTDIVCRATALAVGARFQESVQRALEDLS